MHESTIQSTDQIESVDKEPNKRIEDNTATFYCGIGRFFAIGSPCLSGDPAKTSPARAGTFLRQGRL